MEIKQALEMLDVENDEQWTRDGAPRLEVLADMTGNSDLTREDIVTADPYFTRESLKASLEPNDEVEGGDQNGSSGEEAHGEKTEESEEVTADEYAARMKELSSNVESAQAGVDAAQRVLANAHAKQDQYIEHVEANKKAENSFKPFSDYIESQKKLRLERAKRVQRAMEATHGLPLNQKAPIDAAMTRKNSRGATRPAHPMVNKG